MSFTHGTGCMVRSGMQLEILEHPVQYLQSLRYAKLILFLFFLIHIHNSQTVKLISYLVILLQKVLFENSLYCVEVLHQNNLQSMLQVLHINIDRN
jgi:hypothetical protein